MSKMDVLIQQYCPDGVEYCPLNSLCSKITDGSHFSPHAVNEGYYMPSVKDMTEDNFIFDKCKKISKEDYEKLVSQGCKPEVNDVVIAKDGSMLRYVFSIEEEESIVLLSSIAILRPIIELVMPKYIVHCLRGESFKKKVIEKYSTKGGVPRIILKNFKMIEIPVPPLPVQEEIVRILDAYTELESKLETELETELEMRKKQYEYYREKLFEFDDSVDYKPLGGDNGICDLVAGATPSKSNPEYWDNGIIPWMSSGEVNNRRVLSTENKITQKGYDNSSTSLVPVHSVVIALAGQGKTRGKVAITEIELCTNQSLCSLICHDEIDYRYLYHYLESKYLDLRNISNGDGLRGGLSLTLLKPYLVPVPDMATQLRIVDLLERYDALNVDISESLPAEIKMRHQQYEYYRDKLLTFKRLEKNAV